MLVDPASFLVSLDKARPALRMDRLKAETKLGQGRVTKGRSALGQPGR
jgi:hypothetical protein